MRALILLCALVSVGVSAKVYPTYPVDASRLRVEGQTTVSINCDAKTVGVIADSSDARYFSKQVRKQVHQICYGHSGVKDITYVFKMNTRIGSHDMLITPAGRVYEN